jgi:hypothetical protein
MNGCVQTVGIDMQQHQVVATAEKAVGRQVYLLRSRQVDESVVG